MKFYSKLYNEDKAKEIADTIYKRTKILENKEVDLTKVGAIDEQFSYLKHQYRKLIERYCKITFREGKTKMYIVRVFDTRQHPNKNK